VLVGSFVVLFVVYVCVCVGVGVCVWVCVCLCVCVQQWIATWVWHVNHTIDFTHVHWSK